MRQRESTTSWQAEERASADSSTQPASPPWNRRNPLSVDATIDYPRFNWLVRGKLAGAPHPDLYEGLVAVAPFLRERGVGAIVTLFDRPLEPNAEELGFQYLFIQTPDFRPPPDLSRIVAFIGAQLA